MKQDPLQTKTDLTMVITLIRWLLPLALAIQGGLQTFLSRPEIHSGSASWFEIISILWFPLLVPPAITWGLLTWISNLVSDFVNEHSQMLYRDRELIALNAIGEVAAQSLELDTLLQNGLKKILQLMAAPAGQVRVIEGNRLVLKTHAGIDLGQTEPQIPVGECLCGKCAELGEMMAIQDLASDLSRAEIPCARSGFRSLITIPMKTQRHMHGVILLANPTPNVFGPADQRILTAVGSRMATIVENAQLYKDARRRALHLEAASVLGSRMTSLLELNTLLAEVVKLINAQFGYYHTDIFLVDEEASKVVLAEASGSAGSALKAQGLRLKIGKEGIIGWVAQTGESLLCNDVTREPRFMRNDLVPDTKSELAVPLKVSNRVIGVLDVQSNRTDSFDEEDATVLGILGNQIGIAIENARLFQETKHRFEALAALHETSLDIAAQLDTAQLLKALLRRGTQLLGAQGGVLFVYDEEQTVIRVIASYNTWRDWEGVTLKLGEGVVSQVLLTGKPAINNDYHNWQSRAPAFEGSTETRIVAVPLRWQDQTIGVIDILNNPDGRPFDDSDIWLLSQFADLASIAIKNAELHSQIVQFNQELEQKVYARTQELSEAKEDLAARSEQLKSLLVKTIRVQEDEQARIARDMHDSVVQLITSARLELDAAVINLKSRTPAIAQEKLQAGRELLDEIEAEIRRTIYDLHPPSLDAIGLCKSLEKYATGFARISGVDCRVQVIGNLVRLPIQAEGSLYRMIVQALANVLTHSEATQVCVTLTYQVSSLEITVQDNGCGFDPEQWRSESRRNGSHLGLLGMQERVESLGGSMEVKAALRCGTSLIFRIPVSSYLTV